jgi:hypothetical protein
MIIATRRDFPGLLPTRKEMAILGASELYSIKTIVKAAADCQTETNVLL